MVPASFTHYIFLLRSPFTIKIVIGKYRRFFVGVLMGQEIENVRVLNRAGKKFRNFLSTCLLNLAHPMNPM